MYSEIDLSGEFVLTGPALPGRVPNTATNTGVGAGVVGIGRPITFSKCRTLCRMVLLLLAIGGLLYETDARQEQRVGVSIQQAPGELSYSTGRVPQIRRM